MPVRPIVIVMGVSYFVEKSSVISPEVSDEEAVADGDAVGDVLSDDAGFALLLQAAKLNAMIVTIAIVANLFFIF